MKSLFLFSALLFCSASYAEPKVVPTFLSCDEAHEGRWTRVALIESESASLKALMIEHFEQNPVGKLLSTSEVKTTRYGKQVIYSDTLSRFHLIVAQLPGGLSAVLKMTSPSIPEIQERLLSCTTQTNVSYRD